MVPRKTVVLGTFGTFFVIVGLTLTQYAENPAGGGLSVFYVNWTVPVLFLVLGFPLVAAGYYHVRRLR